MDRTGPGDGRVRTAYLLAIGSVGGVLFVLAALQHGGEVAAVDGATGPLLAFLIDGVPALGLVYAAYRLRASDLDGNAVRDVLAWCLAGLVLFAAVTELSVLIRRSEGRVVGEAAFEVLLSATVGSLAGILAGYYHARARQDARNAERASRTLSFVSGVLRHDLKNDLHVVEAEAELLAARVDGETVQDHVETIEETVYEASELIDSTGDITQTLVGEGRMDTVDLVDLVAQAVEQVEAAFDVTITTDLPDSAPVVGNAGLRSVVRNLLENAAEHTDAEDPRIEIRIESDRTSVRLQVLDNGTGIPEPRKEELFEPRETGTHGGGLYLVSTLVESYGGELSVSDNTPRGSVFTVELPAGEPE